MDMIIRKQEVPADQKTEIIVYESESGLLIIKVESGQGHVTSFPITPEQAVVISHAIIDYLSRSVIEGAL
jgi:hypothetical protein